MFCFKYSKTLIYFWSLVYLQLTRMNCSFYCAVWLLRCSYWSLQNEEEKMTKKTFVLLLFISKCSISLQWCHWCKCLRLDKKQVNQYLKKYIHIWFSYLIRSWKLQIVNLCIFFLSFFPSCRSLPNSCYISIAAEVLLKIVISIKFTVIKKRRLMLTTELRNDGNQK